MFPIKRPRAKKTLFIISAVLVVAGAAAFIWYRSAIFSTEVLAFAISGPASTQVGEEIEYTVTYKNNGNFTLEKPKLVFELPANSLTEDSKTRFAQNLPDLEPGQGGSQKFKGRLLGKEGDAKTAKAALSYAPRNLSVRYEADTDFSTIIEAVPMTLTYDLPTKVEKGKQLAYSVNYFSNIDYPLENLSIRLAKTDGFSFVSSTPSSLDNAEYKLATLEKSKGGRITITGSVTADNASTLKFSARLGMWVDGVFIVIKEVQQDVQVLQPSVVISQRINGLENYSPTPGETLNYQIFVTNTGSTPFEGLSLTSQLSGQPFNLSTLQSAAGQVRQGAVIFNLARLGSNSTAEFNFSVKLNTSLQGGSNATTLKNTVNVLDTTQDFTTKISSHVQLFQTIRQTSLLTYSVSWQVKNDLNDVGNVKVKAMLPSGATLGDNIMPEAEASNFAWDSVSRQIIWVPGSMASGQSKTLSFEVSTLFALNPSSVVSQAAVSAEDQFTGVTIHSGAVNQ